MYYRFTRFTLIIILILSCLFAFSAAANATEGNFLIFCGFDHSAADDPIAFPAIPGGSHLHSFFGVTGVNANTTTPDLLAHTTTCSVSGESVAVWTPAIIKSDSTVVNPGSVGIYYRNTATSTPVYPFPLGLRHVQGNPHNTNQNTATATWRCTNVNSPTSVFIPSTCNSTTAGLEESIYFPSCWNGESINPSDHHPLVPCTGSNIRVPQIQLLFEWPNAAIGGKLSSDIDQSTAAGLTSHGDYFFGANPFFFSKIVERCLNAGIQCRVSDGSYGPIGSIAGVSVPGHPTILTAAEAQGAA